MTGIQAQMGYKPECELHLKKKKVGEKKGIVVGVDGQSLLDKGPNASAGRHKGRICLPPSRVCPFFSLDRG